MKRVSCGRRLRSAFCCTASGVVLSLLASPAVAQGTDTGAVPATAATPAQQASAASSGIGDIVVTARRRSENLQDVPVAITALSGETLDVRNITSVSALDAIAPNVKVVESASNTTSYIQIRGSVTLNPSPGYEPAAAMYIDGVYLGKAAGSMMDIADIEHIEVLRGPQGTLFGRNTLAGAINIVTRKPSGEWGGNLKLGVGDFDRQLIQGSIDLPAFGNFAVKLSGLWSEQDGYIKVKPNPIAAIPSPSPTIRRIGDTDSKAFRAAVQFTPTDTLTFDYSYDYNRIRNTPLIGVLQSVGEDGIFDPASSNYSGVPLYLYVQPGKRPRTSYATDGVDGQELYERVDSHLHALTATWDVGDATIKSITALRDMDWGQSLDLDASPLPLAAAASDLDYRQFSQELQLSGEIERLTYTGGVYYFYDRGELDNPQQFFGSTLESFAYFRTRAYALYGQVDYTPPILGDRLILTAGFRYSHERKVTERSASNGGVVTIPAGTRAAKTFKGSTPTFIAQYEFTPDFNIYAKYAEGFKSGGFTPDASTIATAITPYEPETVKSLEIGSKLRLFDGRMRVNFAAFYDKHVDQHINVFTPTDAGFVTLTANGARSTIKGIELEVQARPVDALSLYANVGHTDAKFTRYQTVVGGPDVADTQAFAFVPRWTASGGADLTLVERDDFTINLAVDVTHSSSYASLPYSTDPAVEPNIYSTKAGALTTVDGRLVFGDMLVGNSRLQTTLFMRNMFNAAQRTAGIDFGESFGNIVTRNWNRPRTVGLDVSLRF